MPIRLKITVQNTELVVAALRGVEGEITDLQSVWKAIEPVWRGIMVDQFSTEGGAGASGKWAPLSPAYAEIKSQRFGDQPILQATGRLYRSLSGKTTDTIAHYDKQAAEYGSSVPYGEYHQTGTSRMPRRPPIDLSDDQKRTVGLAIRRELVKDLKKEGRITKTLKIKDTGIL